MFVGTTIMHSSAALACQVRLVYVRSVVEENIPYVDVYPVVV